MPSGVRYIVDTTWWLVNMPVSIARFFAEECQDNNFSEYEEKMKEILSMHGNRQKAVKMT